MHGSPGRKLPQSPDGQEIDPRHHWTERICEKQLELTGTHRTFPHPDCEPDWDRDSDFTREFDEDRGLEVDFDPVESSLSSSSSDDADEPCSSEEMLQFGPKVLHPKSSQDPPVQFPVLGVQSTGVGAGVGGRAVG